MIFPERIINIKDSDSVLEVGPGGLPHPRANVLLEKIFEDKDEFFHQRGQQPELETNKKLFFYKGDRFPFEDKEFDYVICSHVLEHVDDVEGFIKELNRVGKMGYLEFPTVYYDYLYNYYVHKSFLLYKEGVISWMPKSETGLDKFRVVQDLLLTAVNKKHNSLNSSLAFYFFQGFEWSDSVKIKRVSQLAEVCFDQNTLNEIPLFQQQNINPILDWNQIKLWNFFKFKLKKFISK